MKTTFSCLYFLLFLSHAIAFRTNNDIITREISNCFDVAFGFNARKITEASSEQEMFQQLDACLRLNPLYVEHDDFARSQIEDIISGLSDKVEQLFHVKNEYDLKYDIYIRNIQTIIHDTQMAMDAQYSSASDLLADDSTIEWDSTSLNSLESIFNNVFSSLNATYTDLLKEVNELDHIIDNPVLSDTDALLALAQQYDDVLKEVLALRQSIESRQQHIIREIIEHFESIGT